MTEHTKRLTVAEWEGMLRILRANLQAKDDGLDIRLMEWMSDEQVECYTRILESRNQRFRLGEGHAGCRLRESFGLCG
jgi:hypothetical protein